ncbi:putative sulfotransferase 1C2 [Apostichopus japonicus]|uniref:Putative sulfotransferase 1C2 n=1 Tax=Stichopus japonicus TaxID=307972 RepID=A0A2G8JHV3_STIJA|nr:putative sulfotransferase 1C2 [Apostichopus japonicus]
MVELKVPDFMKDSHAIFSNVVEYEGICFPAVARPHILKQLKTFEVREDDLILATYPKCGTHWMMEVIFLMQHDGHVDKIPRNVNPALHGGLSFGVPPDMKRSVMESLATQPSPRFYITHLPSQLLPPQVWTKKPKVVYVTRNPKDACNSLFRFANANPMNKEPIPWEKIYQNFMSKRAVFGNWFDHTLAYWEHRNDENVCFVTFEEMKKDIRSVIRRLEKFLGVTVTDDGLERIVEHCSLEGMKKTYAKVEAASPDGVHYTRAFGQIPFLQKGVSGGWKALFTDEQRDAVDKMVKERLAGTGLDAIYN